MVFPASARSGRRRRGRSPGIQAAVTARVRRAGMRLPAADCSSVTADAVVCGQLPVVRSGRRARSAARRPLRSCLPGGQRLDSDRFLSEDLDSRRREISLGKRPVDCTVGSTIIAGSSSASDGFESAARQSIARTGEFLFLFSAYFLFILLSLLANASASFHWLYVSLLAQSACRRHQRVGPAHDTPACTVKR
ncbi:uncharacterized protein [Triticum aestivum]|uniref:uncharacterized protein n=1 Tax=Triticum aestivum TaxID=4565 RepID=UPI001D022680|nr:uncharacterized protein LOC123172844 [Triticum aestivum]XP_044445682.1 uncharacterized protein LOC123172845 isoform X1 [Triticum aestivum]